MPNRIILWKPLCSREDKEHYFKFKQKHGYQFTADESQLLEQALIEWVLPYIKEAVNAKMTVVTPETQNVFFTALLDELKKHISFEHQVLVKKDVGSLKLELLQQPMMKAEKEKLVSTLDAMTTLKVAKLAGNQRKRVEAHLFKPLPEVKKAFILDDSFMSGTTLRAMIHALPQLTECTAVAFYGFPDIQRT